MRIEPAENLISSQELNNFKANHKAKITTEVKEPRREVERAEPKSFKLIVDNGKPYEQDFNTLQEDIWNIQIKPIKRKLKGGLKEK